MAGVPVCLACHAVGALLHRARVTLTRLCAASRILLCLLTESSGFPPVIEGDQQSSDYNYTCQDSVRVPLWHVMP